ncbi:LamG domain-containing protein [Herbaspirillum autotrophicum]|uniref:LamG domain-containing protein n=1 Tax=Herbaspirillum autotrophicum TaxID=180195 RepID=UPI00067BF223|nr:LamG domain-containing protein [Herbaspirillum autotrophicum]
MALLPGKNIFDGSKTPAPTVTEMKTAWGTLRDFMADLLGTDSSDKKAARAALGVPSAVDVQAGIDKFAVAAGTGDAMTVTMTPPVKELIEGMEIRVRCMGPNSLIAPTIKLDELPAVTIVAADGGALVTGAYLDKWPGTFRYRASTNKFEFLNPVPVVSTGKSSVRQTVLSGATDANGYASMLSAGAGLALNLSATDTPMVLSFAAGFDAGGENNLLTRLTANVAGVVAGLAASNISYVYADYVSPTSVAWGKTVVPPQYGATFDKSRQALLHFEGSVGSTSFLDDYGNIWTGAGGAKLQSNQVRSGTLALGGSGANNALNGSTDYIKCAGLNTMPANGWTWESYFYLPAFSAVSSLFGFLAPALNNGAYVNAAGKIVWTLSSASNNDIVNGTSTASLNVASWNHVAITYDGVAGAYRLIINGALDSTVTSTLKISSSPNGFGIGQHYFGGQGFGVGYIDEFRFSPYCRYPGGATFIPPVSAGLVEGDFFNTSNMTMYQVTGASVQAGSNPVFTAKNRLYVGEVVTAASAISVVVNYALRGTYYIRIPGIQAANSRTLYPDNIGTDRKKLVANWINKSPDFGYVPGNKIPAFTYFNAATVFPVNPTQQLDRNISAFITLQTIGVAPSPASAPTTLSSLASASWDTEIFVERAF